MGKRASDSLATRSRGSRERTRHLRRMPNDDLRLTTRQLNSNTTMETSGDGIRSLLDKVLRKQRKACGDGVRPLQEKPRTMKAGGDGFVPAGQSPKRRRPVATGLVPCRRDQERRKPVAMGQPLPDKAQKDENLWREELTNSL